MLDLADSIFSCEGLLGSLADIRQSLQEMGSNLMVRTGPLQQTFQEVHQQCQASSVILEEEVEHR